MARRAGIVVLACCTVAGFAAACTTTANLPYGGTPTPTFRLLSSDPADGSATAGVTSALTAVFSEPVDPTTVGATSVRLIRARDGAALSGTRVVSSATVTFYADASLDLAASYRFVLGSSLASASGDRSAADATVHFRTHDGDWSTPVTLCQATYGCTNARISTGSSAEAIVFVQQSGLASQELQLAQPAGLDQWTVTHIDSGKAITPWVTRDGSGALRVLYIATQKLWLTPSGGPSSPPQLLSSTASVAAIAGRASDVALVWSEYDTASAQQKLVVATVTPAILSKVSIADAPSGNVDAIDVPGADTIAAFIASGRSGFTHPWTFSDATLASTDLEPAEGAFTRVVRLAPDPTASHGVRAFWAEDDAVWTGDAVFAAPKLVASGLNDAFDSLDARRVGSTWWLLATSSTASETFLFENSGGGWSLAGSGPATGAAIEADAEGNLLLVGGAANGTTAWAERRLAATGVWSPPVVIDSQSGTNPVLAARPGGRLLLTLQHLPAIGLTVSELR